MHRSLFCLAAVMIAGCGDDSSGVDAGPPGADAAMIDAGPVVCGDGRLGGAEECDDGNTQAGDGCSATCAIEASASCGDGSVDLAMGEQCDDMNTADGDGCSARCLIEAPTRCGDGSLQISDGEECDDGNGTAGDGCSPSCQLETVGASCGDSATTAPEVCDDGNRANGDGCNPTCNLRGEVSTYFTAGMAGRSGSGTIAVDARYLWFIEGGDGAAGVDASLHQIEISTGTGNIVATLPGPGAEGIATNGIDTVWVASGDATGPAIFSIGTSAPYTVTRVAGSAPCTTAACYADGPLGTATFSGIRGLTWYRGLLYIVDPDAAVIRTFDPASGSITTVAGQPFTRTGVDGDALTVATFQSPRYLVSDNSGVIYIADTEGGAIRTLNVAAGQVGTLAGNGTQGYVDGLGGRAGVARVHRPRGITSDGTSVYWVEFNAHSVRQAIPSTLDVSTLAGTVVTCPATACTGGTTCSNGVCLPSGAGPVGGGFADGIGTAAQFKGPFSIAFHFPSNSLFVVDSANSVIRRIR